MTLTITPKVHTPNADALNFGDLVDGEFLKRVGDEIVSDAVAGGGDMVGANNLTDVASLPQAMHNLIDSLSGEIAMAANDVAVFNDVSAADPTARVITLENFAKFPNVLTPGKPILTSLLAGYLASAAAARSFTPNAILDLLTALTAKTTLVDADQLMLADSAASDVAKKITIANLKTTLAFLTAAASIGDNVVVIGDGGAKATKQAASGTTALVSGNLAVAEQVRFQGSQDGAAGNDVTLNNVAAFRITSGTALTGFTGGTAGRVLLVVNTTGSTVAVSNEATSSANNRIRCGGAANSQIPPGGMVLLWYDGTLSRWRMDDPGVSTDALAGLIEIATQAEQETGTDITRAVTPGRQHNHPSAAKGWVDATVSGTANASYNVSSVGDTGAGLMTVNWGTDFSAANYAVLVSVERTSTALTVTNLKTAAIRNGGQAAASTLVECYDDTNTTSVQEDPASWYVVAFGDQ